MTNENRPAGWPVRPTHEAWVERAENHLVGALDDVRAEARRLAAWTPATLLAIVGVVGAQPLEVLRRGGTATIVAWVALGFGAVATLLANRAAAQPIKIDVHDSWNFKLRTEEETQRATLMLAYARPIAFLSVCAAFGAVVVPAADNNMFLIVKADETVDCLEFAELLEQNDVRQVHQVDNCPPE